VIIFGWGHEKTRSFGATEEDRCPCCDKIGRWELKEVSEWFTIFFVPIFPYKREYLSLCPICKSGMELKRGEFRRLRSKAQVPAESQPLFFPCPRCGSAVHMEAAKCEKCGYEREQ
jgi:hypothetical protein